MYIIRRSFRMTNKERRALSITIATCGIMLIGSGLIMTTTNTTTIKKQYSVEITQKRVASAKVNLIKLKDMEIEVGNPLSVNVQDYLEEPKELDTSVIKALKLDTSAINASEPGTYTYTIQFKKKKYNIINNSYVIIFNNKIWSKIYYGWQCDL